MCMHMHMCMWRDYRYFRQTFLSSEQRAHTCGCAARNLVLDESQRTPSPSATCASENSISKRAISATP